MAGKVESENPSRRGHRRAVLAEIGFVLSNSVFGLAAGVWHRVSTLGALLG
jgi:hypothetical protein